MITTICAIALLILAVLVSGPPAENLRESGHTETNPIDGVDLHGTDVIAGHPIKLMCDVKAKPRMAYMYVTFKIGDNKTVLARKGKEQIGDSMTRYETAFDSTVKASLGVHNGMRIQCFAETKSSKSSFGNVGSPLKTLVVHEFMVNGSMFSTETIREGSTDIVKFTAIANPPPQPKQISVVDLDDSGVKNVSSKPEVKKVGEYTYEVSVNFTAVKVGIHQIRVNTSMINKVVHTRRIMFYNFSAQDFKQLSVEKNYAKDIAFRMNLHYRPSPQQFKCTNEEQTNIAITTLTKVDKVKSNVYNIMLVLLSKESGKHQIIFTRKDNKEISVLHFFINLESYSIKVTIWTLLLMTGGSMIIGAIVYPKWRICLGFLFEILTTFIGCISLAAHNFAGRTTRTRSDDNSGHHEMKDMIPATDEHANASDTEDITNL